MILSGLQAPPPFGLHLGSHWLEPRRAWRSALQSRDVIGRDESRRTPGDALKGVKSRTAGAAAIL